MSDANRPTGFELFKHDGCWHIRYIDAEGRRQQHPTLVPLNHPKRATRAMKNLEARLLKALSVGPSVETPAEPTVPRHEDHGGAAMTNAVKELRAIGGHLKTLYEALRQGQVSMMNPWMSMEEAAAYLKYHSKHAPTVVRIMLTRARVPLYRRNNKSFLVKRVDLDEWIETGDCAQGRRRQIEAARASAKANAASLSALVAPATATSHPFAGEKRKRGRPRKAGPPVEPDR